MRTFCLQKKSLSIVISVSFLIVWYSATKAQHKNINPKNPPPHYQCMALNSTDVIYLTREGPAKPEINTDLYPVYTQRFSDFD